LHTLQETSLAARIAEAVISQLTVLPQAPTAQKKRYLREREAAEFMGVSVSALRSWRLRRSKAGPPFTRLGKMVLYPVAEIENHMQAGLVARHK
jgi:predicted DNA-binding transcriptional regulator AlpA